MLSGRMRRPALLTWGLIVVLCASMLAVSPTAHAAIGGAEQVSQSVRPAADLSQFRPGNLISDSTFADASTMNASEIQAFLQAKVPTCQAGYVCLKDWTDTSRTVAADAMCGPYAGVAGERASQIIYKVAQACGINPRVLLVMLQKEQGLVTHTWPSDWRYTIAMGQGCPDTAACDTRYYGFFNQVYGAAWQLKRYANPPGTSAYFTWYAPGKTWNVRYSPNASCGSSPVYIENQATANLYYYTPYQPNAAALRAGYGEGDGCSSYGNRNFFNYFSDWFGSPTAESVALVKTASSATVWILAQGSRWSIGDYSEWVDLSQVFGSTRTVTDAYLSGVPDRGVGGAIVRDPGNGSMALIQGGARWDLSSCEAVSLWGGSCANPINISSSMYRAIPQGPVIGKYARLGTGSLWAVFDGPATRVLQGDPSAARVNGGTLPPAPRMSARALSVLTLPAASYAPGELVRTPENATVFVTDGYTSLVPLSSFATANDLGLSSAGVRTVDAASLSGYSRAATALAPLVTCAGATTLPASGMLYPLADPAATGWASTMLTPDSCALLKVASQPLDVILVKSASDSTVFVVEAGTRRPMTSWAELISLAGPSPRILTIDAGTLSTLPPVPPRPASGTLVKGSGASVYIVDGRQRIGLPSFELARELGLSTAFTQISDAELAKLSDAGVKASSWVTCPGSSTVYFAASGRLHPVRDAGGFAASAFGDGLCSSLDRTGVTVDRVFVKGSGADVYVATAGALSPIGSWGRLLAEAGGVTPVILRIDDAVLRSMPRGPLLV